MKLSEAQSRINMAEDALRRLCGEGYWQIRKRSGAYVVERMAGSRVVDIVAFGQTPEETLDSWYEFLEAEQI